jgi:copper homeostasis protein CutC
VVVGNEVFKKISFVERDRLLELVRLYLFSFCKASRPTKGKQMKILNLTQHVASDEQVKEGVFEPIEADKVEIKKLLTVKAGDSLTEKVEGLVEIAKKYHDADYIMIGGVAYLIAPLESKLKSAGLNPVHAFSERAVVEKNGVKTSIFKHTGWFKDGSFFVKCPK